MTFARAVNSSPLALAATNGSEALLGLLLEAGANPNEASPEGETILMTATRTGKVPAVQRLLKAGADLNATEKWRGETALMWAAAENHPAVVKLLIAHGADPKVRSSDRDTTPPKLMAGTPAAPISRGGLTALVFAARQGSIESSKALLDAGAGINEGDADGNNPLLIAILNNHDELAQMLIERGADVNAVNKDGRSPLFTAVDAHDVDWSDRPLVKETDKVSSLDVIKSLLAHKANVNVQLTAVSIIKKAAQHLDATLSQKLLTDSAEAYEAGMNGIARVEKNVKDLQQDADRARGPFLQAVANGVSLNLLGLVALDSFRRRRLRSASRNFGAKCLSVLYLRAWVPSC